MASQGSTCLLLFARARELAGARRVEVESGTVRAVLDEAIARFGQEFGDVCATATVMVDGEVVAPEQFSQHPSGRELAVLPPVSGGAHEVEHDSHHGHGLGHGHGAGAAIRVAVLTVSDRASRGDYEDRTGPAIEAVLEERLGAVVAQRCIVADDHDAIAAQIARWCDDGAADVVLTNGGTGLSPRDVTPEATRSVLDVEAPGIGELMRAVGVRSTPLAALSRQAAGRRGRTIVVNLPGSVRGATESLEAIVDVLAHAVEMAKGAGR